MSPSPVVYQERMDKLKMMRSEVNWKIENERYHLIEKLCPLINKWTNVSTLRKLWKVFWPSQIELLLMDCFNRTRGRRNFESVEKVFIKFVAQTGYKNKPKVGKKGKISLRCLTPIHRAASSGYYDVIPDLFMIYDNFRANYIDESGFTHFHAACQSGHYEIVEKFLDHGQDPDCRNRSEKSYACTPLHLALAYRRKEVTELLLRRGANANLADKNRWSPLHVICEEFDDDLAKLFLETCEANCLPLRVNARNNIGDTPLHLAVRHERKDLVRLLLKRGANPNIANKYKNTAFHSICAKHDRYCDDNNFDLVELSLKKNRPWQVNAQDIYGNTPLHLALSNMCCDDKMVRLLLKRGANPNSANLQGVTALHIVCEKDDGRYWLKMLFELSQAKYRPLQLDAQDESGKTPLHLALQNGYGTEMAETLLRRGANSNLANDDGNTALHVICKNGDDRDAIRMIFELTDQAYPVQVNTQNAAGFTPLHLALSRRHMRVAELLLTNGADPNLPNLRGSTPLHTLCQRGDEEDLLELFFEICSRVNRQPLIDARDEDGNTPIELALRCDQTDAVVLMLRRGADLNSVNAEGLTFLHSICKYCFDDDDLLETLFEIVEGEGMQTAMRIDARDARGNTPLLLAMYHGRKKTTESLLRRGADPNAANLKGLTALHAACLMKDQADLLEKFFAINDEKQQTVRIDVEDNLSRTPLQLAVANVLPDTVRVLLARGADLSNFVFPTDLAEKLLPGEEESWNSLKLRLASGALIIVDHLEKGGYIFDVSEALIVMKMFVKYEMLEKSSFPKSLLDNKKFTKNAERVMIKPDLSLLKLIQMRPKEAAKQLKYTDYLEFSKSTDWQEFGLHKEDCAMHLCEKFSRRFFLDWALECFMLLIHNRLPILCCEAIIGNLTNEDLWIICLAAAGKSDDDSKIISIIPWMANPKLLWKWMNQRDI